MNEDPGVAAKLRAKNHATELQIGVRLQMVREEKGLSQRELAKRAGVTSATISLIEQENHAPSLASLHKILCAIPMDLADFFALPTTRKNVFVYGPSEFAQISSGAVEMFVMGNERRDKSLQMFLEHYDVGVGTGEELISHNGETAVIVTAGEIVLYVEEQSHRIVTGGGFQIIGPSPYRLVNNGKTRATIICATTPPMARS